MILFVLRFRNTQHCHMRHHQEYSSAHFPLNCLIRKGNTATHICFVWFVLLGMKNGFEHFMSLIIPIGWQIFWRDQAQNCISGAVRLRPQCCERWASRSTSSGSHGFGMNVAPSGRPFVSARPEVTITWMSG